MIGKALCAPAGSWGQQATHYARVLVPGLAGTLVQLAEALASRPVCCAVALAAFALAAPSVLASGGAVCLGTMHSLEAHVAACRHAL